MQPAGFHRDHRRRTGPTCQQSKITKQFPRAANGEQRGLAARATTGDQDRPLGEREDMRRRISLSEQDITRRTKVGRRKLA
jgi:hypothetical protein